MVNFWYIFLAFLFVFLNAFFVAAEFAMVKIRSTRLESLQSQGGVFAKTAFRIVQNLNAYLSATQLGITFTSLGLGWLGEPAFAHLFAPIFEWLQFNPHAVQGVSFALAFTLITILHLVLGELVPKQMAIQSAEKVLLGVSIPMWGFYLLFYPFLMFLNSITNLLVRLLGFRVTSEDHVHTEEEIRLIVEDSYEGGSLSSRKASLLENVMEFTHQTVKHIMIPRQDMVYLLLEQSTAVNLEIAKESGHTRFPLCDGDLDHIIGLINIKDIVWQLEDTDHLINLYDLKRPILFVPETKTIDQLLREFQSKKIHMAVVVNEFGMTLGLVTLEDVIEQIVGEIQDEFDLEQPNVFKQNDSTWIVNGATPIGEVEDLLEVDLDNENSVTIGGHLIEKLGQVPKVGDSLELGPYTVQVTEVDSQRIVKLCFTRKALPSLEVEVHGSK